MPLNPSTNLRIGLVLAGIAAIVLGPFLLQRSLNRASYDAARWLAHTYQVEGAARTVVTDLRDAESAALALVVGTDVPLVRERLRDAIERAPDDLDRLQALTRDNPDQQVRVGKLRDRIEQRLAMGKAIADAPDPRRMTEMGREMVERSPVRSLANEVIAEETRLAAARDVAASRERERAQWTSAAVALGQLVLLAVIVLLWKRETDRRVANERASRASAERAQAILQAVREPIALLDADQSLVLANEAFGTLYDVEPGEMAPRPIAEVGQGAWADPVFQQRLRDVATRGRELWDYELTQVTDGQTRHMVVNAVRMPGSEGSDAGVLLTASDLTARKASEEQVRELNRQLEGKVGQVSEVNRELEAFSYSVSHDLRAPLRHIVGFSDLLLEAGGLDDTERRQRFLRNIKESARLAGKLVDDLLSFSQMGRAALRPTTVDMYDLVSACIDKLGMEIGQRNVDWHIDRLPAAWADPSFLHLAVLNLLSNAVKFTAARDPAVIRIWADDSEHETVFHIADNGAGFNMDYVHKLFGVFQRLHRMEDFQGTGIGLANVRRIVERHDGRVWADSVQGEGATFSFSLPKHTPNP